MEKIFNRIKKLFIKNFSQSKYLLQDRHTFKPMLIEIEDRPVNPVGHFILWAIIVVFIVAILWLSFAKIDVVVTARGKLIPSGDVKTIQATYNGVISQIFVKSGTNVKKGDLLVQLDTKIIDEQLDAKEKELSLIELKIARLNAQVSDADFRYRSFMNIVDFQNENNVYINEQDTYRKKKQLLDKKIQALIEKIELENIARKMKVVQLKYEISRFEKLGKVLDIIPKTQYEQSKKKIVNLKNELQTYVNKVNILDKNLEELSQQKKLLGVDKDSKHLNLLNELLKKQITLKSEVRILKEQKQKYSIVSPVNGYVLKLNINTQDGVVTPAQKILTIVPDNVTIIAKVDVSNRDIGFVYPNMDTVVKVDTFDFQKYGMVNAKVKKISTSSMEKENVGLVYESTITLEKDFLLHNNSKKILKPGMTVTAEMKVGKRRVIEFFIYPAIKYLDEGMSIL